MFTWAWRSHLTALLGALILPCVAGAEVIPQLTISMQDGSARLKGVLTATEGYPSVTGRMTVERSGGSGTMSTRQQREVPLAAGASATIATVAMNVDADGRLFARLEALVDGKVVATSELMLGEQD